nr:hypothetical protein [uncultured Cellulosilyticum sp.]
MLIKKERVVYQGAKLYIEYAHKGDIEIYTLVLETVNQEKINLYAHDSKRIIDFIFDATVAELNAGTGKVVDMDYIIANAYE